MGNRNVPYDQSFFYKKSKEEWALVTEMLALGRLHMLIYGPPGTGKTHRGLYAETGISPEVMTFTRYTTEAAMIGHFINTPNGMIWIDNPVARAMEADKMCVWNEIDRAGPEAQSVMYFAADGWKEARLSIPDGTGRVIKPTSEKYRIYATMNGLPTELLPAISDRFQLKAHVTQPNPEAVEHLPPELRFLAFGNRESPLMPSLRELFAIAELMKVSDIRRAISCVYSTVLQKKQAILDAIAVGGATFLSQ